MTVLLLLYLSIIYGNSIINTHLISGGTIILNKFSILNFGKNLNIINQIVFMEFLIVEITNKLNFERYIIKILIHC